MANPIYCATHLGGLRPGVLDATQPARVLHAPHATLCFATYDASGFAPAPPGVEIPPQTRIVIESIPGSGARFRVVPSARLAPGVLGEGESWPRVIFLDEQTVICERSQWDIYKLDPAYDCYVPAPPAFPVISRIGHPSRTAGPLAGSEATVGHPSYHDSAPPQREHEHAHHVPVSASSFFVSASSASSAGFASSTTSASSASTVRAPSTREFEETEHFQNLLKSSMFRSFLQSRGLCPSSSTASSTAAVSPQSAPQTSHSFTPTASRSPSPIGSLSPTLTDSSSSTEEPTIRRSAQWRSANPSLSSESSFGASPDALVEDFYDDSEGPGSNTAEGSASVPFVPPPSPPLASATAGSHEEPLSGSGPAPFAPPPSAPSPSAPPAPAASEYSGRVPGASLHDSSRVHPYLRPSKSSTDASNSSVGPNKSSKRRSRPGKGAATTFDGVLESMHADETPAPTASSSSVPSVPPAGGPAPAPFAPPPSAPPVPAASKYTNNTSTGTSTGQVKVPKGSGAGARERAPPVADPFFMAAPESRSCDIPSDGTSLGTPDFTLPIPPLARRPGVTVDPPTPTKRTPPIREGSQQDVVMEDAFPSLHRPEKRRKGDGLDGASFSSIPSPPRKCGRELSPETLQADAALKRAQRKRDRLKRAERHDDNQSTQSGNQFWREVFDNVHQQEAMTSQQASGSASAQRSKEQSSGPSYDGGMTDAHRAQIEESRRKLAELEKDRPLWEEQARKRAMAEAEAEAARRAAKEERQRAAQASASANRRRAAEAAAREAELQAAEAAFRAQEYNRVAVKVRAENRRAQRALWSPWNVSRAIPRYQELLKSFDGTKFFSIDNPVDPLMIPWPTLRSPFSLELSEITWELVEAFFAKAKKVLSAADYKALVHTSNRHFHPDMWKKLGLFGSPDTTMNEELRRACIVTSQQITSIWKDSRQ